MAYISRRLMVEDDQGKKAEYSDIEFFSLNAPLVILGEPGSGKTDLVKKYKEYSGSIILNASSIDSFSSVEMQILPKRTIIDGVDEITAYENNPAVSRILSKLSNHTHPNFVLTCRAADWQDAVNKNIIEQRWQKSPIIGRLLPLNHEEIIEFINAYEVTQNAEKFVAEAKRRDVFDLLKNPQNLIMLLNAIKNNGWPETKSQLYETACSELLKEDNGIHHSINKLRPSSEKLSEAAGFIFAQLLFSGKSGICVDGSSNVEFPIVSELIYEKINEATMRCAISTKIFRVAGDKFLEPCHRTVAEFLAAKWIAKSIKNQLSPKRLDVLLYGSGYIVPSALRGLYAWITTLCPTLTEKFIKIDPYGFFRYGDAASLSIQQAKYLLKCLEELSETDPYFRSEDWNVTFGKGLAREELKDDIIRIIRNPSSPYQLSHLIIESIQGDDFVKHISTELVDLILDITATPLERHAAIWSFLECKTQPDWQKIVSKLTKLADTESLRLALQIIEKRVSEFDGDAIAKILIKFTQVTNSDDSPNYSGLGYNLHKNMSVEQLDQSLKLLVKANSKNDKKIKSIYYDIEKWIFSFAQERLVRGNPPNAKTIFSWLENTDRHSYHRNNWDKFASDYFTQNIALRQSVQTEALKSVKDEKEYWHKIFKLSPSLGLREDDIILQMNLLFYNKNKPLDWHIRWKCLAGLAMHSKDFSGTAIEFAKMQAEKSAALKEQLLELNRPPEGDYESKYKEEREKLERERSRITRERHNQYEKSQNELGAGKNLQQIYQVAGAYLGEFTDIRAETPMARVSELVGEKIVPLALQGIREIVKSSKIPSAKEIVKLHAEEGKRYFFESILLVYCVLLTEDGKKLQSLPIEIAMSALAFFHWDVHIIGQDIVSDLQKELEQIVFSDKKRKEQFIRDTIEPYLEKSSEHVAGLYRIATGQEFSDISGKLSIEWLDKYSQLSNSSLRYILIAAICYAPRDELISLIRNRINSAQWRNEEDRAILIGSAFLLDYDYHNQLITNYAKEDKEKLWSLQDMAFLDREKPECWPQLNAKQNHFLIINFGSSWSLTNMPSNGWHGDQNPWDASRFIMARIDALAGDISEEAETLLRGLIGVNSLDSYQDHIKHVYAQQTRQRSEKNKKLLDLSGVRSILLHGEPVSHDDLQALLMDELARLQERIRNGSTNDVEQYWSNDKIPAPLIENNCRDRIASALTPYLERYNIRTHTEGTMPKNTRCDLLNTHNMINVPIEIKGQWHKYLWTSATEQLQNYTKEYHSNGRGIYLVLWFGNNNNKNPHSLKKIKPKTIEEMEKMLAQNYCGISEKTKIFVLDLSR